MRPGRIRGVLGKQLLGDTIGNNMQAQVLHTGVISAVKRYLTIKWYAIIVIKRCDQTNDPGQIFFLPSGCIIHSALQHRAQCPSRILCSPATRSHTTSFGAYILSKESVAVTTKWEKNLWPSLFLWGLALSALHAFTGRV